VLLPDRIEGEDGASVGGERSGGKGAGSRRQRCTLPVGAACCELRAEDLREGMSSASRGVADRAVPERRVVACAMRIATWNCSRGRYERKVPSLDGFGVDVLTVQEIARPVEDDASHVWREMNPHQGVAVSARGAFHVEPLAERPGVHPVTVPVHVRGSIEFVLLGVWAHKQRGVTYVDAVMSAIEAYKELILEHPCVVAGDFNASAIWNLKRKTRADFASLERQLNKLGLVSAYHHFFNERPGEETRPTHYFRWQEDQPFHIDYCFIPEAWLPRLRGVTVPDFHWGAALSDHRPIIVEIADDGM